MAKQAKIKQTDWTKGGRDISNTATPLYKQNLVRLDERLTSPMQYINQYLDQYYGNNAIQNQDFLRMYNRAMNERTGANYAATGGGYTSSGQRAYDDRQRYYNDLASRLQQYGISQSRNMYDQDIANMRGANADYYNAYNLGKAYSDVDQYNDLVDQQNRNWFSNALSGIGNAAMAVAPFTGVAAPFVAGAGALASGAGAVTGIDTSGAMAAIRGGTPSQYQGMNNTYTNLANQLAQYDWGKVFNPSPSQTLSQKLGYNYTPYTTSSMANNALGNRNYFGFNR